MKRALGLVLLFGCGGSGANGNGSDAADTGLGDAFAQDGSASDRMGGPEAGTGGADASAGCVPADVSGYSPTWHPPDGPQSQCSNADLDLLFSSCFGPASTQAACNAFHSSKPLCWACVVTPDTNPAWGAVYQSSATMLYYPNVGGCLAIETGDESATSCGASDQAWNACAERACGTASCPPPIGQIGVNAINSCIDEELAVDGGCASYRTAAVQCEEALRADGGAGAAAWQLCSFATYGALPAYERALAGVFCGPQGVGSVDGGPGDAAGD